jgi:hypothetical protein
MTRPRTHCEAGICGFCIYGERSESHEWDARLVLLDQSGKRTDAAAPLLRIAADRPWPKSTPQTA